MTRSMPLKSIPRPMRSVQMRIQICSKEAFTVKCKPHPCHRLVTLHNFGVKSNKSKTHTSAHTAWPPQCSTRRRLPHLSCPEALDDALPLGLGPLRVDDVHVHAVVDELVEQILGSLNALHKDEHWWTEPLQGQEKNYISQNASLYSSRFSTRIQ